MLTTLLRSFLSTKYRSFKTRNHLEKWQDKCVKKQLKWVMENSPYYKELYKGLDLGKWRDFPLITKQEMMTHFNELNTCKINKDHAFTIAYNAEEKKCDHSEIGEITIGLSSGTSGNRGLFLVSPEERFRWAGAILAKMLPGKFFKKQKIAFFFRTTSSLYNSVNSRIIQLEYYHLEDSIDKNIRALNNQQPTILVSPPSMLRRLAAKQKNATLRINPIKIISVAEVLDSIDRKYISEVFNQDIHQIYQATEGFLASTCKHGKLHLNEDLLVIQKDPVPGDPSRFYPIITDFNRYSQPIIRYRLNDILHESTKPCPCGSIHTAIDFIEGRSDDIFYFQKDDGIIPIFPDFIRKAILSASPHIDEYLATQKSLFELELALKTSPNNYALAEKSVRNQLIKLLKKHQATLPNIMFTPYDLSLTSKKLRRIQRRFQI